MKQIHMWALLNSFATGLCWFSLIQGVDVIWQLHIDLSASTLQWFDLNRLKTSVKPLVQHFK